jgi:MFS family permease
LFFLPLNLIQVQHYSATAAGAALLPFILIVFLLSRWSGGWAQKIGARVPLVIGPLVAAAGFVLFILPDVGGTYWTTFFPAVAVLGAGMAISIAPLTTTVMNSVPERRAGVASGINNAVSRAAGLLAIAIFGIVMLEVFNRSLDRRTSALSVASQARAARAPQRNKLAGAELPSELDPETRRLVRQAIDESFVHGFRTVMMLGALLAVASAGSALCLIRDKPTAQMTRR